MREPLIAGNWKMHKTIGESRELVRALLDEQNCFAPGVRVVVAPPFTALQAVAQELGDQTKIALAAQTMHWEDEGAYTGEISPLMLLDIGCKYVILGHSERRASCGEIDFTVNRKVKSALAHGIIPIVAVGETLEEHEAGRAKERVMTQTRAALDGLSADEMARCALAYEPIWAIGTGHSEDPASADAVMGAMRATYPDLANVQILYGGSVKPANAAPMLARPNIDGALVGGASLVARDFAEIVRQARATVAR